MIIGDQRVRRLDARQRDLLAAWHEARLDSAFQHIGHELVHGATMPALLAGDVDPLTLAPAVYAESRRVSA